MAETPVPPPDRFGFRPTRWSLVDAAANAEDPTAQKALAELCQDCWRPVYAYIRGHGHDSEAARDLTQEFFASFLEKRGFSAARRERGKLRAFLLVCVKHFLTNEWSRQHARKRGGVIPAVTLDPEQAASDDRILPEHARSPEQIFERQWAVTLLDRAMNRLEAESGRLQRFAVLRPFLTEIEERSYKEVAADLEISESAVKIAVHRLRRRFGELLREEVARTLSDPASVDKELRFLLRALQ